MIWLVACRKEDNYAALTVSWCALECVASGIEQQSTRQNAKACLELAERMSVGPLGPERIRLIDMAQQWLDLAAKVEYEISNRDGNNTAAK